MGLTSIQTVVTVMVLTTFLGGGLQQLDIDAFERLETYAKLNICWIYSINRAERDCVSFVQFVLVGNFLQTLE